MTANATLIVCTSILVMLSGCCQNRNANSNSLSEVPDSITIYLQEIDQLAFETGYHSLQLTETDSPELPELRKRWLYLLNKEKNHQYFLTTNHEPDLILEGEPNVSYRFTYAGAFDSSAYIYRIFQEDDQAVLISKKIKIIGSGEKEKKNMTIISDSVSNSITDEQWIHFTTLIRDAYFWRMNNDLRDVGLDGQWWSLEGFLSSVNGSEAEHNYVAVWSPPHNDFRAACEYLIELSNLKIQDLN